MERKDWHKRLLDSGLPEEVVDDLLAKVKDEDLVRMKDLSADEIAETLRQAVLKADDGPKGIKCLKCGHMNSADATTCSKCGAEVGGPIGEAPASTKSVDIELKDTLTEWADMLVARIKDEVGIQEIEVEVPELASLSADVAALKDEVAGMAAAFKDMASVMKDLSADETTVMSSMVDNLSPAQRSRLRSSLTEPAAANVVARYKADRARGNSGGAQDDGTVIMDAAGNKYASLSDMASGTPL